MLPWVLDNSLVHTLAGFLVTRQLVFHEINDLGGRPFYPLIGEICRPLLKPEGLVEVHPGLELGHGWEPREECNGCETPGPFEIRPKCGPLCVHESSK